MQSSIQAVQRWDALDVLRGLSVIGMLFNLNPGAWELRYDWMGHALWQGATLVDMVMPTFLFCMGAVIPLSLIRRFERTPSRSKLLLYILGRGTALVILGLLINFWPGQPLTTMRIPGVLQRIGLCFSLIAIFTLMTSKIAQHKTLQVQTKPILVGAVTIFAAYWILLTFVPVPGFGAPRFDSLGSWPCYIDRAIFGVNHLFIYGQLTDGKVTFDPEGVVSTFFACFNVMLGVLAGYSYQKQLFRRPELFFIVTGTFAMLLGMMLDSHYPIIKSIWTGSFALLSGGFSLISLALLMIFLRNFNKAVIFLPARVYGSNALLIYCLCWILFPVWDKALWGTETIRQTGQHLMAHFFEPHLASLSVTIIYLTLVFLIFLPLYKKNRFIKL